MTKLSTIITRDELANRLDNEAWLTAAERVRCGDNVAHVLSELRPFVARYNDDTSAAAVELFQDIIAGRVVVI